MKNLHRLMGATFQHAKPGLCERCAFRQPYGEWEGYCTARGKVLSYKPAGAGKPRCPDFEAAPLPTAAKLGIPLGPAERGTAI